MKRLLLLLLWGEVKRRIAVVGGNGKQVRQQGNRFARLICRLGEQRFELVQPLLVCVLAPEAGRPLQLCDGWIQGTILVVGRAKKAQGRVGFSAEPIQDGLSDPRFADTWLARYQDHATLSVFRVPVAPHQQLDFLVATDQRRGGPAQRLEPAINRAWPNHLPYWYRIGEAFYRHRAKCTAFEELANEPTGTAVYDHFVRLGQGLKPGRQIRSLTEHLMFWSRAIAARSP